MTKNFIVAMLPLIAVLCASCSVTEPVAVVSKGIPGGIMRGTTTAALSGGSFSVSNGTLSCGGDYNALDQSPTISNSSSLQRWPQRHHHGDTGLQWNERRRSFHAERWDHRRLHVWFRRREAVASFWTPPNIVSAFGIDAEFAPHVPRVRQSAGDGGL